MNTTIARPLSRIATVVVASALAVGVCAGAASATTTKTDSATGVVTTSGGPLSKRSGPATSYSKVGEVANGTTVTISCQTEGELIDGTFGPTRWWDKIGTGAYVSDSYVNTGSDGRVAPLCEGQGGQLVDDYPYKGQEGVDPWNFYKGECTSFVAWRINNRLHLAFNNWYRGQHFGNANLWDNAARALSIPVNDTPTVGSVAQWNSGSFGHVAWVTRVNAGGTVTIEEYNHAAHHVYSYRTIPVSQVENFIHF